MKHGIIKGITNPSGRNFKVVSDGKDGTMLEPIGTLNIFSGRDSWTHYFERARRAGKLERVHYSGMSPIEREFVRDLKNVNHLSFPLFRFKTINNRQYGKEAVGRDGKVVKVPNADYGAVNIFLYLGDNPILGKKIEREREGQTRHRQIQEDRTEESIRRNWKQIYY